MKKIICLLTLAVLFSTSVCFAQEQVRVRASRIYNYLSDLSPVETEVAYSANKDFDGDLILFDHTRYDKGLCMRSDSEIKFRLQGSYKEFSALVGIGNKHYDYKGKLIFEVYADGEKIYTSEPLGPEELNGLKLPIEGVNELTLKVSSTSKEYTDFAVWANAYMF